MNTSLRPPQTADRRRAGWTAFAPLPAVLAVLLGGSLAGFALAVDDPPWTRIGPTLKGFADSAYSIASGVFDAVSDPETLIRGVTGGSSGSTGVE